ncbi:hypothetical protein [Sphingobium xenophagum]|uniref:hypothetical protein n=1 Tax=Sphingobium xenophagum TaxID=121428 RepID=UPI001031B265|nr:hypothetical protein [Sphingobium xenophagum]
MGRREILLGGTFWVIALAGCIIVTLSASNACRVGHWDQKPQWNTGLSSLSVLELTRENQILFDSREMSWSALASRLISTSKLPIQPIVVFRPNNRADCRHIVRIRAMMDRFLECESGGCAEGSEWDTQTPHGADI